MPEARTRLLAHTLPYPIAHALCAIDATSERNPQRKLQLVLATVENALTLLGSIVLVDAYEQRDDARVQEALGRVKHPDHLSIGTWLWIIATVAPTLPRPFVPELTTLASRPEFTARIERFVKSRNTLSHPIRPLGDVEARQHLDTLRPDLDALIDELSFLGRYHLLGVLEEPGAKAAGLRVFAAPLRGRSLRDHGVWLVAERGVQSRDVVLVNADLGAGLVLRPIFLLTSEGTRGSVLALSNHGTSSFEYFSIEHPDTRTKERAPCDERQRPLDLWKWLSSSARPSLRVALLGEGAAKLDDHARLLALRDGGFELPLSDLQHLRSGGMAEVFTGLDPKSGLRRVLKVPKRPDDLTARKHFEHEYKTLSQFNHPSIVRVFGCHDVENVGPCIVEEFFDHPNLQEHLASGPFEPAEAGTILVTLCDAVAALHTRNVVHRDLKPANILYDRGTRALKLIDLGIAKRLDATNNPTTRIGEGSIGVMAPEQSSGAFVTTATDVYALALVARMLYGGLDLGAPVPGDLGLFNTPAISQEVRAVLLRAARVDPTQRFANASELRDALSAALRAPDVSIPATPPRGVTALPAEPPTQAPWSQPPAQWSSPPPQTPWSQPPPPPQWQQPVSLVPPEANRFTSSPSMGAPPVAQLNASQPSHDVARSLPGAPRRAPPWVWPVIAGGLFASIALVLFAARSVPISSASHSVVSSVSPSTAPATAPAPAIDPALRVWELRWLASATGRPVTDPLDGTSYQPSALEDFYSPTSGFSSAQNVTPATIARRWQERQTFNVFTIRMETLGRPTPLATRMPSGCVATEGGPVLQLALDADERGSSVVGGRARSTCTQVTGPYLLWVRSSGDGWRICNESWQGEALCRSCRLGCVSGR